MDLPALLLSFPPDNAASLSPEDYDKSIRGFLTNLSSLSQHRLGGIQDNGHEVLDILDPALNTASYLAVLNARLSLSLRVKSNNYTAAALPLDNPLTQKVLLLLEKFDPIQARYLGFEWRRLYECVYLTAARNSAYTQLLAQNLRSAILRLDESAGTFTTNHLYFIQICLAARAYKEALPILDKVLHSFPNLSSAGIDGPYPCSKHQNSSGYITIKSGLTDDINVADVQEYYILGAMAYIALRMWEDALLYLELVLVTPNSSVANGLMLEAFKKWTLVGCLLHGRPPETSKSMNAAALRNLKGAAKPYEALGEIFAMHDYPRLVAEVDAGWAIWQEDGNLGLCKELLRRSKWFHVLDLQKVYTAVPISKVSAYLQLSPDQAYIYIEELIFTGQLNGTLEAPTSSQGEIVVRFHSSLSSGPLARTEDQMYADLVRQTARTNKLAEHVKLADHKVALSRHHIEALKKKGRTKGDEGDGFVEPQDQPWPNDPFAEEDLMEVS